MLETQNCIFQDTATQISTYLIISLQTFIHHLILWGSILISFLWFALYGVLENVFWDMYFVPFVTMATVEFWSVCALSAIAALLPRYGCLFVCLVISLFTRSFFSLSRNKPDAKMASILLFLYLHSN